MFSPVRAARVGKGELLPAALCLDLGTDPRISVPHVIQAHCGRWWLMDGKQALPVPAALSQGLPPLPSASSGSKSGPPLTTRIHPLPFRGHSAQHKQEKAQTTHRHKAAAAGCIQPNQAVVCAVSMGLCACLLFPSNQRE